MKKFTYYTLLYLLLFFSCKNQVSSTKEVEVNKKDSITNFYKFNDNELSRFGIFISDSSVMYNNKIYNLGTLNIVISGINYSIGTASTPETKFDFYPRYITTLDTVQRYAYNLQGKGSNTVEEAQKWATFDKLIPIMVEQKQNGKTFGESLVFWFTKTDSLQTLINKK